MTNHPWIERPSLAVAIVHVVVIIGFAAIRDDVPPVIGIAAGLGLLIAGVLRTHRETARGSTTDVWSSTLVISGMLLVVMSIPTRAITLGIAAIGIAGVVWIWRNSWVNRHLRPFRATLTLRFALLIPLGAAFEWSRTSEVGEREWFVATTVATLLVLSVSAFVVVLFLQVRDFDLKQRRQPRADATDIP